MSPCGTRWHGALACSPDGRRHSGSGRTGTTSPTSRRSSRDDPGATHATEIVYAFNNLHAPRVIPDVSSPTLALESRRDRAMAEQMSSHWVTFARTGDPNGPGLPTWQPFTDPNAPAHVLGDIAETLPAETLNAYDERYAQQLAALRKP
jgi:carboxylesterase type B